jgi:ECF sigma factor
MTSSRESAAESGHNPAQRAARAIVTRTVDQAAVDESRASSLPALFATTNVSHPVRNVLLLPDGDIEIRDTVLRIAAEMIHSSESPSFANVASQIQDILCGPEPLATSQLLRFLDAVAWTNRRLLNEHAARALHELESGTASTRSLTASVDTTDQKVDESATSPNPSLSGLTLAAARTAPDQVQRKLKALGALENETPQAARWFQLVDFTGATTAELARYFSLPHKTVEQAVGKAIHTLINNAK